MLEAASNNFGCTTKYEAMLPEILTMA